MEIPQRTDERTTLQTVALTMIFEGISTAERGGGLWIISQVPNFAFTCTRMLEIWNSMGKRLRVEDVVSRGLYVSTLILGNDQVKLISAAELTKILKTEKKYGVLVEVKHTHGRGATPAIYETTSAVKWDGVADGQIFMSLAKFDPFNEVTITLERRFFIPAAESYIPEEMYDHVCGPDSLDYARGHIMAWLDTAIVDEFKLFVEYRGDIAQFAHRDGKIYNIGYTTLYADARGHGMPSQTQVINFYTDERSEYIAANIARVFSFLVSTSTDLRNFLPGLRYGHVDGIWPAEGLRPFKPL